MLLNRKPGSSHFPSKNQERLSAFDDRGRPAKDCDVLSPMWTKDGSLPGGKSRMFAVILNVVDGSRPRGVLANGGLIG